MDSKVQLSIVQDSEILLLKSHSWTFPRFQLSRKTSANEQIRRQEDCSLITEPFVEFSDEGKVHFSLESDRQEHRSRLLKKTVTYLLYWSS